MNRIKAEYVKKYFRFLTKRKKEIEKVIKSHFNIIKNKLIDKKKKEAKLATFAYYGNWVMFILFFIVSGLILILEKNDPYNFRCASLLLGPCSEKSDCSCVRY